MPRVVARCRYDNKTIIVSMKVLQLGKFYPIRGGVEKVMYDLMAGLDERGVACDMLCAATSGRTRTVKVGSRARVFCCRSLRKVAGTMLSPTLVRQTRRICKDYDIIHVHHPDPTACLALLCSGFRGRVVLHWHSDIVKQRRLLKLYEPMQRWLIRRADIIIGTTPVYLAESPFLREVQHKVDCLPIGVSPMHPQPEAVARLQARYPGKKIVFSLGRLVPYKGFKYLVRAARYLDDSYVVLIGGSGPLEAKLRGEIEAYGLEGRVQLLGQIADADLPAYYGACSLFCLPSVQRTEAFGIVQIEAMSCARPVVATRIPGSGVAWVNEHGVSGLNVAPGDDRELADAILAITRDEETYRRFSLGALSRYRQLFTKDNMIDRCITFYNRLSCGYK